MAAVCVSEMVSSSGDSVYRDEGIIPTNKFKLIKFLFHFQNLVCLTLHCVKFNFCYIGPNTSLIHNPSLC